MNIPKIVILYTPGWWYRCVAYHTKSTSRVPSFERRGLIQCSVSWHPTNQLIPSISITHNGSGLVIVDIVQNVCLINMGTADIYGSVDPFQRMPKSPRPGEGASPDFIQRVDLSNYSQCGSDKGNHENNEKDKLIPTSKDMSRVLRSPNPGGRSGLHKTGSSAEESSVSKSLSSSVNSLDQVISSEGVSCVEFVDTFATKNDYALNACAMVGTTLGSIVMIIISLPDRGDPRTSEPVVVSPSGR